jgi:hypothetical protein
MQNNLMTAHRVVGGRFFKIHKEFTKAREKAVFFMV